MEYLEKVVKQGKKLFVFLGEAGSGKSEIAVNWALKLAAQGKPVRFFDMDQTKPLFRSREVADLLQKNGVMIEVYHQVLDAPTIPPGIFDKIQETGVYTILDIGGSVMGAKSIGQFAEAWGSSVEFFLVVNCYRSFSGNQKDLLLTIESITAAARVKNVCLISNPNLGTETTLEDVVHGHHFITAILQGTSYTAEVLSVPEWIEEEAKREIHGVTLLGISRYIKAPWEDA